VIARDRATEHDHVPSADAEELGEQTRREEVPVALGTHGSHRGAPGHRVHVHGGRAQRGIDDGGRRVFVGDAPSVGLPALTRAPLGRDQEPIGHRLETGTRIEKVQDELDGAA
jgi:hypothetical protein